jgi:mRNA-degrading endonuclease toxin of MazEF toxin-antitoxin module
MADVSQGQIYRCDFGAEGGVELAGPGLAMVVSRDDYNRASSSVLVVPTTRGDIDPLYVDYYRPLEQLVPLPGRFVRI